MGWTWRPGGPGGREGSCALNSWQRKLWHPGPPSPGSLPSPDSKVRVSGVEHRTGGNSYNSLVVLAQLRERAGHSEATHPLELVTSFAQAWTPFAIPGVSASRCVVRVGAADSPPIPHPQSYILSCPGSRTVFSENHLPDLTTAEFADGLIRHLERRFRPTHPSCTIPAWLHFEGRNLTHLPDMLKHANDLREGLPGRPSLITLSLEVERPDRVELMDLIPHVDVCFFSEVVADFHGFKGKEGEFLHWSLRYVALRPAHGKLKHGLRRCRYVPCCSNGPILLIAHAHANENINAPSLPPPTSIIHTITLGERGAIAGELDVEGRIFLHAVSAPFVSEVRDTVGAGDTFIAGFIDCLGWQGLPLRMTLQGACALASKKCAQHGFAGLTS